jgi:hypothetical protein
MTIFLGFALELTIDRVLVAADGPQLSTGTDPSGQRWLVYRCRSDGEGSVWLCSPITDRALQQVELGWATPRDAFRHSCTGLVEVVSCAPGRAIPEQCLPCGEIPEALLPPPDLMVDAFVDCHVSVSLDRRWVSPVAAPSAPSTCKSDARWTTSDEPIYTGSRLCPAA